MGFLTTIFIYVSQLILHKNLRFLRTTKEEHIIVVIDDDPEAIFRVKKLFEENHILVEKLSLKRLDNATIKLKFDVIVSQTFDSITLLELVNGNDYIKEICPV